MGKVRTGLGVSLDGFISGPNDGPAAPMGVGGERLWPGTALATPTIGCPEPTWSGDKDVGVGAASIVQQCLRAGLLDELHLDLVPVLLGGGVSLFDHLGSGPIDLECTRVIEGPG